jgi:leucyl aminopeptidase (aminopeptidase T)
MMDLAEAFVIECRRAGAQVFAEFETDETFYDRVMNLPPEYLETPNPFSLALADMATAEILIGGPEDPARLKQVPATRWGALAKADKPYMDKFLQRKIRWASIDLGIVTSQRAKTYGFDYETWKANVKAALNVKYEDMQKLGKRLARALEKAHEVRVSTPRGSDLTFTLEGRPVHIRDGVIDDEDLRRGAIHISLPDGTVNVAPLETSPHGTFSSDVPEPQWGVLIHDAKWIFEDGVLTSMEGGANIDVLRQNWKEAAGDTNRLGSFTLGINPKAQAGFTNSQLALGTATITIGENRELGGKNESKFRFSLTTTKPTVALDGKAIMKRGKLLI